MNPNTYPHLTVTSPHKDESYLIFFSDFCQEPGMDLRITLGRGEANHIDLPDPDKKVSRRQCVFEYRNGMWWVVDEGSANGTYVKRFSDPDQEIDVRGARQVALKEGDMVLILGAWKGEDTPLFWRIIWHDQDMTDHDPKFAQKSLEYQLRSRQLWRMMGGQREMVALSQQQRLLVQALAERTLENGGEAAVCSSQELVGKIWEEPFGHKAGEVNRLVWSVRNKIEEDGGEPCWLVTCEGGYSLRVKVVD